MLSKTFPLPSLLPLHRLNLPPSHPIQFNSIHINPITPPPATTTAAIVNITNNPPILNPLTKVFASPVKVNGLADGVLLTFERLPTPGVLGWGFFVN